MNDSVAADLFSANDFFDHTVLVEAVKMQHE